MGEERVLLEDHSDIALMGWQVPDVAVVDVYLTFGCLLEAADKAQHGCLARSAGAQQSQELAGRHVERDVVDGFHVSEML